MSEENKRDEEEAREQATPEEPLMLRSDAAVAAYRKQAEEATEASVPAEGHAQPAAEAEIDEVEELKDLLQRKVADFENYRKRVQRERDEMAARAAAALIGELLPVLDGLELALASEGEGADDYRKGVEMILQQFRDVLKRHGLEPIESVGRQFDPHLHEALASQVTSEHPEGWIVDELQRGYTLAGKVLRPARVRVVVPPEQGEEEEEGREDGPRRIPIN
jgi:molecular chaperone GrpE